MLANWWWNVKTGHKWDWDEIYPQIQADLKAVAQAISQLPASELQRWIANGAHGATLLLLQNSKIKKNWTEWPVPTITKLASAIHNTTHPNRRSLGKRVKSWIKCFNIGENQPME